MDQRTHFKRWVRIGWGRSEEGVEGTRDVHIRAFWGITQFNRGARSLKLIDGLWPGVMRLLTGRVMAYSSGKSEFGMDGWMDWVVGSEEETFAMVTWRYAYTSRIAMGNSAAWFCCCCWLWICFFLTCSRRREQSVFDFVQSVL